MRPPTRHTLRPHIDRRYSRPTVQARTVAINHILVSGINSMHRRLRLGGQHYHNVNCTAKTQMRSRHGKVIEAGCELMRRGLGIEPPAKFLSTVLCSDRQFEFNRQGAKTDSFRSAILISLAPITHATPLLWAKRHLHRFLPLNHILGANVNESCFFKTYFSPKFTRK